MNKSAKTIEIRVERTIPAPSDEVFDAWLNPGIPGNPWNAADKFILDPKVDGLFYWALKGTAHYGRFVKVERPDRIQHTWVSPNTLGEESTVTVTFKKQGEDTLMTLVHSDLPDTAGGRAHENGWNFFLNIFPKQFGGATGKKDTAGKMNNKNYTTTIEVAKSPKDVFNDINDVPKWWSKDYEGSSAKLNDEFVIHHVGRHYSKQKLVEVVPDKKVVWLVTDSRLDWLEKDKSEWTNTKMVFQITTQGDKTVLRFTHEGLVPEKECYARCEQGWNMVIKERLFNFITGGKAI